MTQTLPPRLHELIEDFESFPDWEDRYEYLIELGFDVPDLPEEFRTEEHRVQGCTSQVWLVAQVDAGAQPPVMEFLADSDSQIVKGLVAILLKVYSGRSAEEIRSFPIEQLFAKLGLHQHLSRSRSNGLHAMVQRIRQLAEQVV